MRYLGGKSKIRKQLSAMLKALRLPGQTYFEPFVGGGWILQEMDGKRIASDGNAALVNMYRALKSGWIPPQNVSEEEYAFYKLAKNPNDPMTAFCGFGCSFAGKWFGGYARHTDGTGYAGISSRSLLKQLPKIKTVDFIHGTFEKHDPHRMLVYCDPPYAGATSYGACDAFDHSLFWDTMRKWSEDNTVLVSEYAAPDDWVCVAEFDSRMGMTADGERGIRIERLFWHGPSF